jgi:hypothetical protein
LRFADTTYLTVRADVPVDSAGDETEPAFLGTNQDLIVFTDVADLARYCRTADGHRLHKLEWWPELADITDDEAFLPSEDLRFDLRKPSTSGAELLREIAEFCNIEADTAALDDERINRDDWAAVVAEIRTCLREGD